MRRDRGQQVAPVVLAGPVPTKAHAAMPDGLYGDERQRADHPECRKDRPSALLKARLQRVPQAEQAAPGAHTHDDVAWNEIDVAIVDSIVDHETQVRDEHPGQQQSKGPVRAPPPEQGQAHGCRCDQKPGELHGKVLAPCRKPIQHELRLLVEHQGRKQAAGDVVVERGERLGIAPVIGRVCPRPEWQIEVCQQRQRARSQCLCPFLGDLAVLPAPQRGRGPQHKGDEARQEQRVALVRCQRKPVGQCQHPEIARPTSPCPPAHGQKEQQAGEKSGECIGLGDERLLPECRAERQQPACCQGQRPGQSGSPCESIAAGDGQRPEDGAQDVQPPDEAAHRQEQRPCFAQQAVQRVACGVGDTEDRDHRC